MRFLACCNCFRRAFTNDIAACLSSFGADIDNMVGTFDYIHIVLNYNNRVPTLNKRVECAKQRFNIVKMQSCGWLIENENGGFRFFFAQIKRQFYALIFTAG